MAQHPPGPPFDSGDAETAPLSPRTPATGFSGPRAAERAPERIGPYKVLRELGRGGMGVVYLAQREDGVRQRVAIKVVRRGMDTEDILARFDLERRVLAALNHPNIARLVDGGATEDGRPYFVVEYIEGLPIDKFADSRRLRISERLELFRQVCSAVHYAHQNLIVHRDIKPSNIIVTQDGVPKLLDFGIAKMLNPEMASYDHTPTAAELRLMTPEYASPEQVRGEPLSTASDVYSLGVLLYELLTGHRPYRLRTRAQQEIVRVICEEDPERPSTAVSRIEEVADAAPESTVPGTATKPTTRTVGPVEVSRTREGRPERLRRRLEGDIDNIVLMAMRKEPQRRYVSAEQLAEDIRRHLAGLPVMARADSPVYRAAKFVLRNRWGVAAAAALFIALSAGVAGTTWQWRAAQRQRDIAMIERDRADQQRAAAEQQRAIADTQRARAEAMVERILGLSRTFIFDFHDAIVRLPGATRPRQLLVETATQYLDGIAKESPEDERVQQFLMSGFTRLGEVEGGIRGSSLGDREAALEKFRRALAIAQWLHQRQPSDPLRAHSVAICHIKIGDALSRMAGRKNALDEYRAAANVVQTALSADPSNLTLKRDLAIALINIGDMLYDAECDVPAAFDHFERSLAIRRENLAARPQETAYKRDLSTALVRLVSTRLDQGQLDQAEALLPEAIALRQGLLAAAPDNARERRDVMRALYHDGLVNTARARKQTALERLRSCLQTAEELSAADPDDVRALLDIAEISYALADPALAATPADALRAAQDHRDRLNAMAPRIPADDPALAAYLCSATIRLGDALIAAGRPADANIEYSSAFSAAQTLASRGEVDCEAKRRIADAQAKMEQARQRINAAPAQP